eukprot:2641748-Prymnesium_polylepis.3
MLQLSCASSVQWHGHPILDGLCPRRLVWRGTVPYVEHRRHVNMRIAIIFLGGPYHCMMVDEPMLGRVYHRDGPPRGWMLPVTMLRRRCVGARFGTCFMCPPRWVVCAWRSGAGAPWGSRKTLPLARVTAVTTAGSASPAFATKMTCNLFIPRPVRFRKPVPKVGGC